MKRSRIVFILALAAVLALCAPSVYAGEPTDEPAPTQTATETAVSTPTPTQTPSATPTPTPTATASTSAPAPTPTLTSAPTQEPAQTQSPAPAPEDTGTVDLTVYVRVNGEPAAGYSVTIDGTTIAADADGKADFKGVTVEKHSIAVVAPDGGKNAGTLNLSRGDRTVITDKAMGGVYGLTVARGISHLYMDMDYAPGEEIGISGVSETVPAPAASSAFSISPDGTGTKTVSAVFMDGDKTLSGIGVMVTPDGGSAIAGLTNGGGGVTLDSVPYGGSAWLVSSGSEAYGFFLNMAQGDATGLAGASGDENGTDVYAVTVSPLAATVYLTFTKDGDLHFTLANVSETAPGGEDNTLLGVVVIAGIIVAVIVIAANVRKRGRRAGRGAVGTRPPQRSTGGANKFGDHSRM